MGRRSHANEKLTQKNCYRLCSAVVGLLIFYYAYRRASVGYAVSLISNAGGEALYSHEYGRIDTHSSSAAWPLKRQVYVVPNRISEIRRLFGLRDQARRRLHRIGRCSRD